MVVRRGSRLCAGVIFLFLISVLTAAGASPLATQKVRVGSYPLLLSYYSLPRAGQELNMTIEPDGHAMSLQFDQPVLNPAKGTDANTVGAQFKPDHDSVGVYDITATPPIRGAWLLHITVTGPSGSTVGNIPIDVQGPPIIPPWLAWLIGLLPLPLLMLFVWMQVGWRKEKAAQVQQEMLERPSF